MTCLRGRKQVTVENRQQPDHLTAVERTGGVAVHALTADTTKASAGCGRPEIVCLVGSTRFAGEFNRQNLRLTLEGRIVLSIGANVSDAALGISQDSDTKQRLDVLHLRKIDLADRVLCLNVGGYIGESTRREIAYATAHGKPIEYLESEA